MEKLTVSVHEAAESLSISEAMIRKLLRLGTIAKVKVGSRVVIERIELEKFIEARRTTTKTEF